ncbi:MAG: NAD(P)H dehydrogenase [Firmicutes bacterium]|jgi:FMN-dependent NADH-azoreductase|nr:NAD(P)H dehydrogenase [Bacillota bacterium]
MKVLFVNACLRGERSRTLQLCRDYLVKLKEKYPEAEIEELNLETAEIEVQSGALIEKRDVLLKQKAFDDPMFDLVHQLIEADHIVIGAPYWDLSFPAKVKVWLERCSVDGLTFIYSPEGIPQGQCKADSLTYITTAGGYVGEYNFGFDYVKGLCSFLFGIPNFYFACAQAIDIVGVDVAAKMTEAKEDITKIVSRI